MDKKSWKRITYIFIVIFFLLAMLFFVLWYNDILSVGWFISFLVIFILLVFFGIIYSKIFEKIKISKKQEVNVKNKPITDKEAKAIIENRLAEPDYADYISETLNDGTSNFGEGSPSPIYIGYFRGEYETDCIIGIVNKITKEKKILLWDITKKSQDDIKNEILDAANRLATHPARERIKRIWEESPLFGISKETLEQLPAPIEKPKEEEFEFKAEEEKK